MSLRVIRVGTNRRWARAFVDVPWTVYENDTNWVPPLHSAARRLLDRRRNPFYRHADVEHFVLLEGRKPVGRIAATVYPPYVERYETKTGFFGFFDTLPDGTYASKLLSAAEHWLAERGMARCAGPYNYCSTQEMGLLIDGFEEPPAAFQTYNRPEYQSLLETHGYEVAYSMSTFRWDVARHAYLMEPVVELGVEALRTAGLTTRPLNRRDFGSDMELLRRLFNASFADNADVLPYEADVFHDMVAPLRRFVEEDLVTFIEDQGEPVAFTVILPNVNELLSRLSGSLGVRDLVRLRRYRREIRSGVLLIIGALPRARGGIGLGLVAELGKAMLGSGYEALHTTWINDQNAASNALIARFGVAPNKRFAIFDRSLTA